MKTKSKRFLNLATLCLALLGTTLLMGQPVKAEAVYTYPQSSERSASVDGSGEDSNSEETGQAGDDDNRDRKRGYEDGYKFGQNSDSRDVDRNSISVPHDVIDGDDYKDGYQRGVGEGWSDSHPVETFLQIAWYYLTNMFYNLFGGGEGV
ncbi:TPA: hypothetical protein VPG83_000961 [Streptococcus pyogenes]|nr:hypothetical protein [Streptococcus pyogenes]HES9143255.1 hypothetical protein [Streptococcus pyogenes]HES9148299.1 hypothetical protein [Streptococcus pyogenes]